MPRATIALVGWSEWERGFSPVSWQLTCWAMAVCHEYIIQMACGAASNRAWGQLSYPRRAHCTLSRGTWPHPRSLASFPVSGTEKSAAKAGFFF